MSPRIATGCAGSLLVLLALIGIATAWIALQGRRAPTGRPAYVALGSSFAAGAGLGAFQPDSPWLCARSIGGYPPRLATARGLDLVDRSCGGAVTAQVVHGGQFFQPPQVRAVDRRTRLVTLTVGGNDIGYVGDLSLLAARNSRTVFGRLVRLFWSGPRPPASRGYGRLSRDLTAALRDIRRRAPDARVVVATYPAILPSSDTCPAVGLTVAEADRMRRVGDRLAAITRTVAAREGALLVDMHVIGAAHHACSPSPWVRGWSDGGIAPFHPTARGARATAAAISAALDRARPADRHRVGTGSAPE